MTLFLRFMGISPVFLALCLSAQEIHESKDDFLIQSLDASYARGIEYLATSQGSDGMWTENPYGDQAGVLGMAISTIIILMTINGHAVCEIFGKTHQGPLFMVGALIAGIGVLGP